jgi:hypothetical protein
VFQVPGVGADAVAAGAERLAAGHAADSERSLSFRANAPRPVDEAGSPQVSGPPPARLLACRTLPAPGRRA